MAEPMEMLFGCRLLGPNNYLLYWGVHIGATGQMHYLNDSFFLCSDNAASCQIILTTCVIIF